MVTRFDLGGNDEVLPETERDVEPSAFVFHSIDLRLFYWYPHHPLFTVDRVTGGKEVADILPLASFLSSGNRKTFSYFHFLSYKEVPKRYCVPS